MRRLLLALAAVLVCAFVVPPPLASASPTRVPSRAPGRTGTGLRLPPSYAPSITGQDHSMRSVSGRSKTPTPITGFTTGAMPSVGVLGNGTAASMSLITFGTAAAQLYLPACAGTIAGAPACGAALAIGSTAVAGFGLGYWLAEKVDPNMTLPGAYVYDESAVGGQGIEFLGDQNARHTEAVIDYVIPWQELGQGSGMPETYTEYRPVPGTLTGKEISNAANIPYTCKQPQPQYGPEFGAGARLCRLDVGTAPGARTARPWNGISPGSALITFARGSVTGGVYQTQNVHIWPRQAAIAVQYSFFTQCNNGPSYSAFGDGFIYPYGRNEIPSPPVPANCDISVQQTKTRVRKEGTGTVDITSVTAMSPKPIPRECTGVHICEVETDNATGDCWYGPVKLPESECVQVKALPPPTRLPPRTSVDLYPPASPNDPWPGPEARPDPRYRPTRPDPTYDPGPTAPPDSYPKPHPGEDPIPNPGPLPRPDPTPDSDPRPVPPTQAGPVPEPPASEGPPDAPDGGVGGPGGPPAVGSEGASCMPSGWGWFNPIEWVLKPIKCAFRWLFVPSTDWLGPVLNLADRQPFASMLSVGVAAKNSSFGFSRWYESGPACFDVMAVEVCPRSWDFWTGPVWILALMMLGVGVAIMAAVRRMLR